MKTINYGHLFLALELATMNNGVIKATITKEVLCFEISAMCRIGLDKILAQFNPTTVSCDGDTEQLVYRNIRLVFEYDEIVDMLVV